MTALQSSPLTYADALVDRFAKDHPYSPTPPPMPLPVGYPTLSPIPDESLGESIVKTPGRLAGAFQTEVIVNTAMHLDYAVSRIAGAVGATGFARDVQADAQRIGREDSRTTLGRLGRDPGLATWAGSTAGVVLKWGLPAIGATDLGLAAHEAKFRETGSDAAAFGSAAIEMLVALAGFRAAQKFSPALARQVGALAKTGQWSAAAGAVGSFAKGAGSLAGLTWAGMVGDEMQTVAWGAETADQAWENIKEHSVSVIEQGALSGAFMTGGAAIHHSFIARIKKATNIGEVAKVMHEAQEIAASPEAVKIAEARTDVPPPETPPTGEGPPKSAMGAAAAEELKPGPVSIKGAAIETQRERIGLPTLTPTEKITFEQLDAQAAQKLADNPGLGDELVAKYAESKDIPPAGDNAVIGRHLTEVTNEYDRVNEAWVKAEEAGDTARAKDLSDRSDALFRKIDQIGEVTKKFGTEQSHALNSRRMAWNADMTLAKMINAEKAARGVKELPAEAAAEVKRDYQESRSLIKEIAERSNRAAKEGKPDAGIAVLEKKSDAVQERFQNRLFDVRTENRLRTQIKEMQGQIAGRLPMPDPPSTRKLSASNRQLKFQRDQIRKARDAEKKANERGVVRRLFASTGLLRLLETTGEFSFIGRQGGKAMFASVTGMKHAKTFAHSVAESFKAFASDAVAKASDERLFNHPDAPIWDEAGLRVIHEGEHISGTEEVRIASWIDQVPVIKQFNRAARVFFNELRTSSFEMLYEQSGRAESSARPLAKYVNQSTGYGSLGGFEKAAPAANAILFSARNTAANFQWLAFNSLWHSDRVTAKIIAEQYARTFIGMGVFYGLAHLAGARIGVDPNSSDFGKIIIGNTRIDPLMGLSQVTVFASREITGEWTDAQGKSVPIRGDKVPYGGYTAWDVATNFARNKFAPVPSLIIDLAVGKDPMGQELGLNYAAGKVVPITYMDVIAAMKEQGVLAGSAEGMAAFFGMGLQTYKPKGASGPKSKPGF